MEVFLFFGAPNSFLLEHPHPLAVEDSVTVAGFVRSSTGA